jgi:tetratricopeptide (TPR) repeat protein
MLRKTLDSLGIDAAINYYKDFKKDHAGSYDFSEGVLNTLGYDYLDKNLPAALALFKLNIEEYPTSYRVYHSYADALYKEGDRDVAIQNYKKSLEINPANMKAVVALENLGATWEPSIVNIPSQILHAYTGTYRMQIGPDIKIIKEEDQLFAESIGMPKISLYPKSQKEFYTKVVRATLTFDDREHTLTLYQGGQVLSGRKVE